MKLVTLAAVLTLAPVTLAQSTPVAPASPAAPQAASPATSKAKAKIYDEAADAKAQIGAALARAKKENKRVLIQWGGNWCPWCIRLHELFASDQKIAKELQYEYELVLVDAGQPKDKNLDLARSYGAELEKHGYPYLTILDATGKPRANQETEALEVKNASGESSGVKAGHNPEAILKFLTQHQPEHLVAKHVLAAGLTEAKSSGKVAFVHFGAPWCVWCRRLENWMARPDVSALLGKAFVDLKIDTDRMTGGQEMLDGFRKSSKGGIPFFAFTDGGGVVLADSNGPRGNIGFPSEPEELDHFESMLKKATRLSAEEIAKLIGTLKESPSAGAPAHPAAATSGN